MKMEGFPPRQWAFLSECFTVAWQLGGGELHGDCFGSGPGDGGSLSVICKGMSQDLAALRCQGYSEWVQKETVGVRLAFNFAKDHHRD